MLSNSKSLSRLGYDMHRCPVCAGHPLKRALTKRWRAREKRAWRAESQAS